MFKKEIREEIEILASSEEIWKVLTDFEGFSEWNPFIRPLVGVAEDGARLRVQIRPPGGRAVAFRPRVTKVVKGREFRWKGRLLVPGLLDGEHIFEIEPLGPERSRFVQREIFSGLLVPFMAKSVDQTLAGFGEMNRALKERVEGGDGSPSRDEVD
ncbi:SRPBCC family protein [Methanocrinis sp.]|uniref:SRPBCC family protein n=1 Tax=Methanocrinis sp. TaxID=3101522 RepID=UPI003D0DB4CB